MPTHAVFSCVTPAYYMHGSATGQYNFTTWLGNNSKTNKTTRLLREIQGHMRLRISGDRNEVRQSYMQTIFDRLVRRFAPGGTEAIVEIIVLMDEYYLTREDFDSIIEISLGPNNGEALMKDVPSNVKAAFTRKYASCDRVDLGIILRRIRWRFRRRALLLPPKGASERDLMSRMLSRRAMRVKLLRMQLLTRRKRRISAR